MDYDFRDDAYFFPKIRAAFPGLGRLTGNSGPDRCQAYPPRSPNSVDISGVWRCLDHLWPPDRDLVVGHPGARGAQSAAMGKPSEQWLWKASRLRTADATRNSGVAGSDAVLLPARSIRAEAPSLAAHDLRSAWLDLEFLSRTLDGTKMKRHPAASRSHWIRGILPMLALGCLVCTAAATFSAQATSVEQRCQVQRDGWRGIRCSSGHAHCPSGLEVDLCWLERRARTSRPPVR